MNTLAAHNILAELQSLIDSHLHDLPSPKILEAGCGSSSRLTIPPNAYLVGIDLSEQQLNLNTILSEKILGDIQEHDLPASDFDMIVCWDVLEHLDQPEKALRNFAKALKPGGIVVLAFPNPSSVKGFLTRITPHCFHVWAYKYIFKHPWAGKPGRGPFRTAMKPIIEPAALEQFAAECGLMVRQARLYEGGAQEILRSKLKIKGLAWSAVKLIAKAFSLGKLDAKLTDCLVVLERTYP